MRDTARPPRLDRDEARRLRRQVAREHPEPDRATLAAALEEARGPESGPAAPAVDPGPDAPLDTAPDATPDMTPEPAPDTTPQPAPDAPGDSPAAAWEALPLVTLDPRHLARNLIVTAARTDPAHGAFDVLRTRILTEMQARGWRRLGVTSPTKGCGKTFTAANLALTLSRLGGLRTLLLDLDLRQPAVARVLGLRGPGSVGDMLRGAAPPESVLRRVAPGHQQVGHLVIGANARREPYAAELFRDPSTAAALAGIEARFAPDILIFDLPPALAQDDVLALRPLYDALLMVAGGGQTTPRHLREAARRLGDGTPILGVVLNKAEGEEVLDYAYGYG